MMTQITDGVRHVCGRIIEEPEEMSGDMWFSKELSAVVENIKYYKEQYAKEVATVKTRNHWIESLLDSLPQEGV